MDTYDIKEIQPCLNARLVIKMLCMISGVEYYSQKNKKNVL